MLRKIRITLAALFLVGITLLFVGIGRDWWGWMPKLQLLPAAMRIVGGATLGNVAVVAAILLVTLVFGRIYCSVICPLGVFQDVVMWLRRQLGLAIDRGNVRRAKKAAAARKAGPEKADPDAPVRLKPIVKHFKFSPERRWPRFIVLAATVVLIILNIQFIVALIAPYSAYGRIVATAAGLVGGATPACALLWTAIITFVVIAVSAWQWGRAWCNTVCPVGTVLGYVSKAAVFKIRIDESKCKACGRCGRGCKASCIDMDAHTVDYSRCVDCFDCIRRCKEGAITFGPAPKKAPAAEDSSRRAFLSTAVTITAAAALGTKGFDAIAQEVKGDGGLAPVTPKQAPERAERLVPPGARSVEDFYSRCTACQLCVQNCPNGVLRPSTDLEHLLQPVMSYENGWCRPECTACSDVCPTGAILPLAAEAKTLAKIGTARVDADLCLAASGEAGCGNCERHCPTGAVTMVKHDDGRRFPEVSEEQCIGCGACEYLCPVRPVSAITVDGISIHRNK